MKGLTTWAYKNLQGDPFIWLIVIIFSLFSIMVVYSATVKLAYINVGGNTEYYLIKHSFLVIVSLLAMWVAHRVDYRYYSKISRFLLWVSVPLLVFTFLFGTKMNEASRWLTIPIINHTFQPSDLAGLALVITLASMLSKRQKSIKDFQAAIIPMLVWIGLICGLIALTNISSAVLLFITCFLILFIGRVQIKHLFLLVLIVSTFGSISMVFGQRYKTAISRIQDFKNEELPDQTIFANIAIASGGIIGKGPGQSDQRSFLTNVSSDFIYALIIEEYGLVGGVSVLLLYLALLFRGIKIAERGDRAYGSLLCAGLSFTIVMQALVNMCVAVGLLPVTGLTLPLLSMGGTSQLFAGISLGIILSVSRGETSKFGSSFSNQFKEAA